MDEIPYLEISDAWNKEDDYGWHINHVNLSTYCIGCEISSNYEEAHCSACKREKNTLSIHK